MFNRFLELAGSYVDGEIVPLSGWDSEDLEDLAQLIRDELDSRYQEDYESIDGEDE